ncbi:hypothetical protein MTR67_044132 [Solanum verrucosum]|uniref:Uncharacterized protein n=1 Tax=Solanum verrucosum TaxID=315347 RepID=A0AAF0ZSM8_SOLVR|nr:hypothetical protein MTR67_044132 [Solanum verrucosum]
MVLWFIVMLLGLVLVVF